MPFVPDESRKAAWDGAGPLELRMVERYGTCSHEVGARIRIAHPNEPLTGLCPAMAIVANAYLWRAALGFPSWEADDRSVYRLHCPSRNGSVWELRKVAAV